ncbi:MAG: chloride channel protein [Burkholderiales bacterium]|nr:chloride channel protein [Burkholderiales bacterium]
MRVNYIEPVIMLATILRWLLLASITGAIVGTGVSFFLQALFFLSEHTAHVSLWTQMALLPLAGILNGLLLHYGYREPGSYARDSVISAIHLRSGAMSHKTILIKPLAALITLALGGSAGKEGPCSHIGGTLASWFGQRMRLDPEMQKRLVACGVSAGFAAVFGTPLAGAIYGIEMLVIGRVRHDFIFPAVIAAITAFEVGKYWGMAYDYFPVVTSSDFSSFLAIRITLIGILCGLVSWLFIELLNRTRYGFIALQRRFHIWQPLMPLIGGLVLAALILVIPTDYLGLSLPLMNDALQGKDIAFWGFLWKSLLVAITLGSGFYGGIVTPQFVIGAMAGSAFAHLLGVNPALGAAVGMVAVVAAASNTPIAAVLMGFELFGNSAGPYFATACVTAYIVVGHRSVYSGQLLGYSKSLWVRSAPDAPLEPGKIHISYSLLRRLGYFRSNRWRR